MSTYAIDYKRIKEEVSMRQAIDLLQLKMTQKGADSWRGACPACPKSDERSLVVTEGRGFKCFKSGEGGSVIDLVRHVRGIDLKEAAKFLKGDKAPTSGAVPTGSPCTSKRTFDPEEYARKLKRDHEGLSALGLSPETMERFQCGYGPSGVLMGRFVFRIDDAQGRFVTFGGLALKGETPKLKFGDDKFGATSVLFNAFRVEGGEARLVRDPVEVMSIWEQTGEDCVCLLTELIAPEQFELIAAIQVEKRFACYI